MATQATLEILVKAFVEGLQKVETLSDANVKVGESAVQAGEQAVKAGDDIQTFVQGVQDAAKELNTISGAVEKLVEASTRLDEALNGKANPALDEQGKKAKKSAAELNVYGKELTDGSAKAIESAGANEELSKKLDKVGNFAKTAAKLYLAYLGVHNLKQIADEAAQDERLALALEVVGKNAGYAGEQLVKWSEGLQALGFSSGVADKALTKLITTGVDLNRVSKEGIAATVEFANLARNLSAVSGQSEAAALEQLTRAVERGNERMFKNIGLRVDLKRAEEEYAASMGVTVAELTKADKAQAAFNASIEAGTKFGDLYSKFLDTTAGKISQLRTEQERLTSSIGKDMAPAYNVILDTLRGMAIQFRNVLEASGAVEIAATRIASVVQALGDRLATFFIQVAEALAPIGRGVLTLIDVFSNFAGVAIGVVGNIIELMTQLGLIKVIVLGIATTFTFLSDVFIVFGGLVNTIFGGWSLLIGAVLNGIGTFIPTLKGAGDGLKDLGNRMIESASKTDQALEKNHQSLLNLASGADTAKKSIEEVGSNANFQYLQSSINEVAEAFRKHRVSASEAATALKIYQDQAKDLHGDNQLSTEDFQELNGTIDSLSSTIKDEFSVALGLLKLSPGELSKGYNDEAEVIGRALTKLAGDATKSGEEVNNAFTVKIEAATSVQALAEIYKSLQNEVVQAKIGADNLKEALARVAEKSLTALDVSIAGAKTTKELKRVEKAFLDLVPILKLSDEQLAAFNEKLIDRTQQLERAAANPEVIQAFKDLGLTATEAFDGTTEGAIKASQAVRVLGLDAEVTGVAFQKSLGSGLNMVKTLGDIALFKKGIDDVAAAGTKSGEDLAMAYDQVNTKLEEMYQTSLKAADTKVEFSQLTAEVYNLAAAGVIGQQKLSLMLEQIAEKATGARASLVRMAQQSEEAARAATAVNRDQLEITKQIGKIDQDNIEIKKLEKRAREENTKEARAALDAAKAQKVADEALLQVKKDQAQVQIATMDLIAAKQEKANADAALERDKNNVALQQQAENAAKMVEQKQIAVSNAGELLAKDQSIADTTAAAADEAKRLADNMKEAGDQYDDFAINKVSRSVGAFGFNQDQLMTWFTEAGVASKNAFAVSKAAADDWAQYVAIKSREAATHTVNDWIDFINQGMKVIEHVKEIARQMKEDKDAAEAWSKSMENIADYAERAAEAITDGKEQTKTAVTGSEAWADAMYRVSQQVRSAAKGAEQAALSFMDQVAGIREQLLRAQGKEVEATKLAFEGKRRQLAIEERLLEIKIRSAILQAQAAGDKATAKELEGFLRDVKSGYQQALADLKLLEALEVAAAKESEKAAKEAAEEKRKENQKTHTEKMDQIATENAAQGFGTPQEQNVQRGLGQANADGSYNAPLTAGGLSSATLGAAAGGGGLFGAAGGGLFDTTKPTTTIPKVIQVDFNLGGKTVSATIDAAAEQDFLDLIEKAQASAA